MTTNDNIIKMNHVTTIELLQEKLGIEPIFDQLWAMSLTELEALRDSLIPKYNKMTKKNKKNKRNQETYKQQCESTHG